MEQTHDTRWEQSLAELARRFDYPPTPAIADNLRGRVLTADGRPLTAASPSGGGRPSAVSRRLAWALAALIVIVLTLLAAPPTRATLLAFFARVGAIDIFIDETAPTAAPSPTGPAPAIVPPTTTVAPATLPHALLLLELGEPTTLAEATRRLRFMPLLPAALGEPEAVYLHRDVDLPAVTFVWGAAGDTPLSLTAIGVAEFAQKFVAGTAVEEVAVGDATGLWLTGPHRLQLFGDWQGANQLLITSNVLIWVRDGVTYRLEGDVGQAEAIEVAESLGD